MKITDKQKKTNDFISDREAIARFCSGRSRDSYEYFGCHKMAGGGIHTYVFRVWAPRAEAVALVSDFCGWEDGIPLCRIAGTDVWELQYGSATGIDGSYYKYKITGGGRTVYKADPYAVASQTRWDTASVLRDEVAFPWEDSEWIAYRRAVAGAHRLHAHESPLNIYCIHLGSWQRNGDGRELNYREIADRLAPYVKQMGYTHVQLMPIAEYTDDYTYGYRVGAYYAPTSRYGSPEDLMYFVNRMHLCGVGVIFEWVPSRFSSEEHGLSAFDGHPLFEEKTEDGILSDVSDVQYFDFSRGEVKSFLLSNAMYWIRRFHADGLRVVSVSDMLGHDPYGGKNIAAAAFLQELNRTLCEEYPSVMTIADGATTYKDLTKPVSVGGLGFTFCQNDAWTGGTCAYMSADPIYRQYMHDKLITPAVFAHGDSGVLSIPYEQVSGGRGSLISQMYGGYEEKFAAMRAFFTYMMTFPGKKQTFMGCELSQFREWNPGGELEWYMIREYPRHAELHNFIKMLNNFYLSKPPLWELDGEEDGFAWLEPNDKERNVIAYRRIARDRSEILVVINFSPVPHKSYRLDVPSGGGYKVLFATDGASHTEVLQTKRRKDGKTGVSYLDLQLLPYSAQLLEKIPTSTTNP